MKTLRRSSCAVLPLVLRREWYDMVDRGEKKEEYRDDTPYWAVRLGNWDDDGRRCVVEFRRGYAKDAPRMAFEAPVVVSGCVPMHPEWGEPDTPHYVIALGERVILEGEP